MVCILTEYKPFVAYYLSCKKNISLNCTKQNRKVKQVLFAIILLFSGFITSAQGTVTIRGTIRNPLSDSIKIFFNNSRLIYDPVEYKALLDDGNFQYSFKPKDEYTSVIIGHGKLETELLAVAGDDLQLTAEVKDSTWTVTYTGTGSERANFIAKHAREMGFLFKYPSKIQKHYGKDVKPFMKDLGYDEDDEMAYLDKNKAGLSPQFIRYMQQMFRHFTYFGLFQYPLMHEVTVKNGYNFSTIPPVNYDAVKNVPPAFNDSFMSSIPYRLFADHYYRMQLEVAGFFNDSLHVFRMQDSVAKLAIKNMPPATAEFVVALHLYAAMRGLPLDMVTERMNAFKKRWPNSMYKKELEAQYAIAKRLAPGEKAYDFSFTTAQGKNAKLSDFKGRVVMLGFWSSTDRRSMLEVAAGGKMANHYKDHPVSFIYVSLDTEDKPWIEAIEKYKLGGIHTRENGAWKSLLAQMYGVQGMPAFYLIDQQGKFVMAQTPLPSQSTRLAPVVDKLLGIPPSVPGEQKK
jgi:peroxiredoxin